MSATVSGFYDGFIRRLLYDYVAGNKRAEAAIRFAVQWTPESAGAVLDIGCGVGWSTRTIIEHTPGARAIGLDLSPALIDAAKRLQGEDRMTFIVQDVTKWDLPPEDRFDAIVMLDVYEHIPANARSAFHASISSLLTERGRLILTCPSPIHQAFLREKFPERLQPVDEDVAPEDFQRVADDLGGALVCCAPTTIWSPGDYTHAVISRAGDDHRPSEVTLESRIQRRERVQSRLGVRPVGPSCAAPAGGPGPNNCVAVERDEFDESAQRQIHHMPGPVRTLSGPDLRRLDRFDRVFPISGEHGPGGRFRSLLGARRWDRMLARAGAKALRRHGVEALLVHNPSRSIANEMAQRAGIPAIAYVSDWSDAFHRTVSAGRLADFDRVVAASPTLRRLLTAAGVPEAKVIVAPIGVSVSDDVEFDRPPVAVVTGPLTEDSGCRLVVEAFAKAHKSNPEARLVLAGRGPLERECLEHAARHGVDDAVVWSPPISEQSRGEMLATARCWIRHSVGAADYEHESPRLALEAMALGTPVIECDRPEMRDVVTTGETGLLVPQGDVCAIADALVALLDREKSSQLGSAVREHVRTNHSVEREMDAILSAIQSKAAS